LPPRHAVKRLSLIFWGALLFAVFLSGYLFRIQVLQHEHYLAEAERQHKRKIILPSKRGDILDRNGKPLALSAEGLDVYAVPERIKNKKAVAGLLAAKLHLKEKRLLQRLSCSKPFVMIRRKVNPLALREIQEMKLEGIGFIPSSKRYYPRHTLAAQVVGYVGVDDTGLAGVEFRYEDQLRGKPGWIVAQRDARGNPYNVLDYPIRKQTNGRHLRLTIEAEFQEIVEEALRRAVIESGAVNGCVVAVNPHNGQILAMANYPSVDLNTRRNFKNKDFLNLATNLPFEPGSTFKPFTASALLAGGYVSLGDSVYCENGVYTFNKRTIRDVHKYGTLSFCEVIAKSSNIGMSKLIRRIPDKKLYRQLRAFGFGCYTGQTFKGEDKGFLPLPSRWDHTTKTSLAIGYSVMVTPLQMAMAYASLANGGILYEPALIAEIFDESGKTYYSFKPHPVRRALSEEVCRKITRALIQVVEKGTGTAASVAGFRVAGKTGTSMKTSVEGGYDGKAYIGSFGGFFPAENPQIAMFITINEPDFSYRWGGKCAAPVFSEIIRNTLYSTSNVIDRRKLRFSNPAMLKSAGLSPRPPAAESKTPHRPETSFQAPEQSQRIIMPEVTGFSIRKAVATLRKLGLKARITGGIKVSSQFPKPGTLLSRGEVCSLKGVSHLPQDNSFSMLSQTEPPGENNGRLRQSNGEKQ